MYRLEGADSDWFFAGTNRRVMYANLAPGRYVLHVRGSNSDGVWSEKELAIPMVIAPPYWQTWWFRLLLIVALGLLTYAGFRYRLARLMVVEKLRLRIAQDLHDDIGSTLSGIALTSGQLIAHLSDEEQAKKDLQELRQVAAEKADSLRDLVWTINPEKDSASDLLLYLKETVHRMLRGMEVTFTGIQDAPEEKITLEVKHNVTMIFREILHNILSHSRARHVEICVTGDAGRLRLRVTDDGVGFDPNTCTRGSGLVNLEQRTRAIGGTIKIETRPGAGTTIVLDVKIT
jgi:signal transduction histidine kinase